MRFWAVAFLLVFLAAGTYATEDNKKDESYIACGCGCCGGEEPAVNKQCVPDKTALQEIIRKDKEFSQSHNCAVMGCAKGEKYIICRPKGS